MLLQTVLLLLT